MRQVTISGGANGRTVTVSGGDGAAQTVSKPTPVITQMYAYPNVTINNDPAIVQRVSDLETKTQENATSPLAYYILTRDN